MFLILRKFLKFEIAFNIYKISKQIQSVLMQEKNRICIFITRNTLKVINH